MSEHPIEALFGASEQDFSTGSANRGTVEGLATDTSFRLSR